MVAAAFETWEGRGLLRANDKALAPAKQGATGALIQTAGMLSGPIPMALRLASMFMPKNRRLRQAAAISGILGSLLLRYGWVRAGSVSARDWKIPLDIPQENLARDLRSEDHGFSLPQPANEMDRG